MTTTTPVLRSIPVMRPWLDEQEQTAASAVIASAWVEQRPRVAEFERPLAARVGAVHGVARRARPLYLLGADPGDQVLVPSFSFIATAHAARHLGARLVLAEVDPVTGTRRHVATAAVHVGDHVAVVAQVAVASDDHVGSDSTVAA